MPPGAHFGNGQARDHATIRFHPGEVQTAPEALQGDTKRIRIKAQRAPIIRSCNAEPRHTPTLLKLSCTTFKRSMRGGAPTARFALLLVAPRPERPVF